MSEYQMSQEDALRMQRAVIEFLGVDPEHVQEGSVRVEGVGGDPTATVTWVGTGTLPVDDFIRITKSLALEAKKKR